MIRILIFSLLFSVICIHSWSQKIELTKGVHIEYLALKVSFGDSINQFQHNELKNIIEDEIFKFNSKSKNFNIYLVDELQKDQTGMDLHIDRLQFPSTASHHNTFYFSLLWPLVSIGLAATGSNFWLFWFAYPLSQTKNSVHLTPALTERSEEPVKNIIYANAGWFKSYDEQEEILFNKTRKSIERLFRRLESQYKAPKLYRKNNKLTFDYATLLGEVNEKQGPQKTDEIISFNYPVDSMPLKYHNKSTFDISSGVSLPGSTAILSAFNSGVNFYAGPKWITGQHSHISFLTGFEVFTKTNPEKNINQENLYNIKMGGLFYFDIPMRNMNFSVGPHLQCFYNMGNYQFHGKLMNKDVNEIYLLAFRSFSAALGMRMYYRKTFIDLSYHYFHPNIYTDGGHDYPGFEFPQRINLSTIQLSLGISLRKGKK